MMTRRLLAHVTFVALAGCSTPPSDGRYVQQALPDRTSFPPVAQLLVVRCGSLDCHGTPVRNLRIYGSAGLRWSPGDRPLVPLCDTQDEVDQDYESVVGLEPETMSAVVAAGGANPEQLTMVRKARGTEAHKGGQVWAQGDDSDTCLTSWLAASADANACARAMAGVLPGGSSNPLLQCLQRLSMTWNGGIAKTPSRQKRREEKPFLLGVVASWRSIYRVPCQ